MSQQRLTESPEKAKQHIAHRESRPDSTRSFQGGLHPILQLQRMLGNWNVAQLIQAKRLTPEGKIIGFQRKLTVGATDDQYEQEADRVARQMMNTSDAVAANSMQRAMPPEEDKDQILQTKPLAASITPFAQRQMVNNAASEDQEKPVQAKSLAETSKAPLQRQPEIEEDETEPIQAKSAGSLADSFEIGADVEAQVSQSKGRGSPLPDTVRAYLEPRFGVDFSHVHVHTGSDAVQMNHAVGAQAFTHGSDIYFGEGYSPSNLVLTAHELTHVVQQKGSTQILTHDTATVPRQESKVAKEEKQFNPIQAADLASKGQSAAHLFALGARAATGGAPSGREKGPLNFLSTVVSFKGLAGGAGDAHEQHADRVADAVVVGKSAAPILDEMRGGGVSSQAVQRDDGDGDQGMSYAPELGLSASSLSFGSVPVGTSSKLRQVTVTNNDTSRTVEIEDIKDFSREAVGEFSIAGVNAILEPGQSITMNVSFAPARWGDRRGMLQIQGSAGAVAYLRCDGTATDHPDSHEKRQKTKETEVDKAREDKSLAHHHERSAAEADIDRLNKKVTKFAEGEAHWASQNYTRFLSETGGDFTVSWTEGQFINAVGAVGSGLIGLIVPGGPLVGAVAGTLFSLIYGGIFTAKGNADDEKTVHDNFKKTGKGIEEKSDAFESQKDQSLAKADEAAASAEHKVWTAKDPEVITGLRNWAQEEVAQVPEPRKKEDRSLYQALLKDWVRERAGDANQANKSTNAPAWNEAREKSFGKKGDQKLEEPDLFIYQARHEWSKLGVGGIEKEEANLRARFEKLRLEAVQGGLSGADLASYIKNMMGEIWVFLPVHEPSQTAKVLQEINVNRDKHDYSGRRLGCEVWLDTDGGSVTVSGFNYHLGGNIGVRRLK